MKYAFCKKCVRITPHKLVSPSTFECQQCGRSNRSENSSLTEHLINELQDLTRKGIILKENTDFSVLANKVKTKLHPMYDEALNRFINFDVSKDHLTKTELNNIKHVLDQKIAWDFGQNTADFVREVMKRDGLTVTPGTNFTAQHGTPTGDYWYTILDMLMWDNKIPSKYIKMMNPLEKEIYEYQQTPRTDTELKKEVTAKLKAMKGCVAKREPKSVAVAREREVIKGALNPNLRVVIDEIAEEFRKVIEEQTYERELEAVTEFLKSFPSTYASEEEYTAKYFVAGNNAKEWRLRTRDKWSDSALRYYVERSEGGRQLKPNYKEIARQIAIRQSTEIIASFAAKMYDKLGGFLTELGKDFEVEHSGRLSSNDIHFKFADGSKFSLKSQVVGKQRDWTYYYAYPTTFHDAYLGNGTRIAQPSESTIKAAFLGRNQTPTQEV